jgi:hypothetical protein
MTDAGQKGRVHTRPSQARDPRGPFARGFRQRNPLVLVAAATLTVLFLLLLQVAVTSGDFTAVSQGRFLRIPNDDWVHITYELATLKKHPPQGTTVYLFGGSGAMESFVTQQALAAAIAKAGGGDVNVISLAAHQQTLAQTLAIIDNLPPGKAVLLIGLGPSRFTTSPQQDAGLLSGRPIIAPSPWLARLAPRLYGRSAPFGGTIPGIFDYLGSYVRQRAATGPFWGLSIPYAIHYYPPGAKGALPLAKRQEIFKVLRDDRSGYAANAAYDFFLLRQIVQLSEERGYKVVFYDQPLNVEAGGPTWGGVLPAYRSRAEAMAQRFGVPYIHVERGIHLHDADFADLYHLLEKGRILWQAELARLVAPIAREVTAAPAGAPASTPSPAAP